MRSEAAPWIAASRMALALTGIALAGAALAAGLLLSSCASRPAQPAAPSPPEGSRASLPAAAPAIAPAAAPTRSLDPDREYSNLRRAEPGRRRVDYLDAALSDYWRETLPNGATLAIKRQAGRKTSAARIILARGDYAAGARAAGFDALAMDTAARRASGAPGGSVEAAALKAGASMTLRLEDYDDVALEFLCPAEGIVGILEFVAGALASPAFAQADFDRCLRDARVAERRESGDPLLRAAAELRSRLFGDHPYGLPPRGTAASLAAATREEVERYWSSSFGAERLSVVVVADAEPRELAGLLRPSFGALPRGGAADGAREGPPKPGALPIRPWFKALSLSATPGSAVLRGEFGAPDAASPDFAAMTVALAMLDDLLLAGLRGEEGLAYGAWTRLSSAAAPSASLTVYKTPDPAAAKAAVDAAIAELAGGRCLDVGDAGGALGPVSRSLDAYKARAITASYSRGASSEGMAARIARDLASGGDGTGLFRMAGRIRSVSAEAIVRVARQRLLEGPSAWVALGDPELVLGLREADFVKPR